MKAYFKRNKDRFFISGRVSDYLGYKGIEISGKKPQAHKEIKNADISQGIDNQRGTDW